MRSYQNRYLPLISYLLVLTFPFPLLLPLSPSSHADFTVEDRKQEFKDALELRLKPLFKKAGLKEDPVRGVLVFYKDAKRIDLYAGKRGGMKFIKSYRVLAASGVAGPKLIEGDLQVPEGVYRVESLNPNSRFHLSLRLNYPNEADRIQGKKDGRTNLGGDIMIHGNEVSLGCIAIGDAGIEELFTFAARSELEQWKVILAPTDFRLQGRNRRVSASQVPWIKALYKDIESELRALP